MRMFTPPPKINSISINSNTYDALIDFCEDLSTLFYTDNVTNGKHRDSNTHGDLVFENKVEVTGNISIVKPLWKT